MAGAAHARLAALLERLEGADLVALGVDFAAGRAHLFAEFVVEAFGAEISFFLGHPFLQAEMRFDQKFRHGCLPGLIAKLARTLTFQPQVHNSRKFVTDPTIPTASWLAAPV